jgi:hypothetical protein
MWISSCLLEMAKYQVPVTKTTERHNDGPISEKSPFLLHAVVTNLLAALDSLPFIANPYCFLAARTTTVGPRKENQRQTPSCWLHSGARGCDS